MREFSTQITEGLLNGLKPNKTASDALFLSDLRGLVPYELGLRSYENVTNPFPPVDETFPFPQWFRFQQDNLLVTSSRLLTINESFLPFELSYAQVSEWNLGQLTQSLRGIDYGKNWLLLGPEGCVFKYDGRVGTSTLLRANSLVHHKNRTVFGGPTNGFWTLKWIEHIRTLTRKGGFDSDMFSLPLRKNFVVWSSFDSTDFPYALLFPEEFIDKDVFLEGLYGNSLGFMEMPFRGAVLEVISSQGQVFVFGEDGLVSISQSDATGATFAITGQQPLGLKCRGAAGGDETSVVFIDRQNQLWKISGGLTKLDFREYMEELEGDEIFIIKDPDEELFHIGDGKRSFVLKNNGLTRVNQTISSLTPAFSFRSGVTFKTAEEDGVIQTDEIDLGVASNKTLTGIFISANRPVEGWAVATAEVRGKRVKGKIVRINKEGYAATRVYGKNIQVSITFDSYKDLEIDRIELKWQIDDNRHTRGTFVTENATGTGS